MMSRCCNPNCDNYMKYGAKGIKVCERWVIGGKEGFNNFLEDMGERPKSHSLNRINGATIYSKETCEWATTSTQAFDQGIRKDSPEKLTGVKFREDRGKWVSYISFNNELLYLYYGESKDEALEKRKEAEIFYYGYNKGER